MSFTPTKPQRSGTSRDARLPSSPSASRREGNVSLHNTTSTMSSSQLLGSSSDIASLPCLRVQFPNARDTNAVRKSIEIVLSEVTEFRDLREVDHSKVRAHVDLLHELTKTLDEQMTLPVEVLRPSTLGVTVAQREAKRVAVEELMIASDGEMTAAITDRAPHPINPQKTVVVDDAGERKLRLLMEMLTQSTAEVARLRDELAAMAHKLAQKDFKIIELEASVHGSNLSMTAMELAMTKLKRKAAVGGGGGGGGFRGGTALASTSLAMGSVNASEKLSLDASSFASASSLGGAPPSPSGLPTAFHLPGNPTPDMANVITDRIAMTRRSIVSDRRRCVAENAAVIQVDALGQDFGPKGRIALVVVLVPNFHLIAGRYPDAVEPTLDTLRDSIRGMLELCDGFEFRQKDDMFACAFDDSTGALEFALNLTNHLHNTATWLKELEYIDEFRSVVTENGTTLFRGLRVSIGVHTGQWNGSVDLLCQRKMYEGDLFDKTVIVAKSCPPGLAFATNDVIAATGVKEFLRDRTAAQTPIPPWAVHVVVPNALKDRVAKASAPPDAPLARAEMNQLLMNDAVAHPPQQMTVVCVQVEGFLSTLIEGDVPQRDLYRATSVLQRHLREQMKWSASLGSSSSEHAERQLPSILREESGDKYVVAFESCLDAFDFALALQTDCMRLCWPETLLAAGIGVEERAEVPDSHRLQPRSGVSSVPPPVTIFRGLRLQVGIHTARCCNLRTIDWFNGIQRWNCLELNVAVGLSCVARGGEIVASAAARDVLCEEQRRCKSDTRLNQLVTHKVTKRIFVPGQNDALDAYYVANHVTAYRFRDAFPESAVNSLCRIPQYGFVPIGTVHPLCAILTVAVSHAPLLHSTNPGAFHTTFTAIAHLVALCCRRFGGWEAATSDDCVGPTFPFVCVFPDAPRAAAASVFLQDEALSAPLDPSLQATPYTEVKASTDNTTLYAGPRLKIGLHVGSVTLDSLPPASLKPIVTGDDVRDAVSLCEATQPGTSLLSAEATRRISGWISAVTTPKLVVHELVDFAVDGMRQRGNYHILLPHRFKERVLLTPSTTVDSALANLAIVKKHAYTTTNEAPAPAAIPSALLPRYDPGSCVISGEAQMFVVCRLPGITAFFERAPQFARDVQKMYLNCARELLVSLKGKELQADNDAILISFETAANAVQWAQQLQVSLVCAKWPVEVLSTDFCKEIRSTTKTGGAGRIGSLFRGPRALISMEWGAPTRIFDTATQKWKFFGEPLQFAIELSHWGHGGMIVLSKRAKAAVVDALTIEATRQMLESPNISVLGTRHVALPNHSREAASAEGETSQTKISPQLEQLFSLVPVVFFERHYPPFPDQVSDERRFSGFVDIMWNMETEEINFGVQCIVCPNAVVASATVEDDITLLSPKGHRSRRGKGKTAVTVVSPRAGASSSVPLLGQPIKMDDETQRKADESGGDGGEPPPLPDASPRPLVVLTDDDAKQLQPFLRYFNGKMSRWSTKGFSLQFPHVADAVSFSLCFSVRGPQWARTAIYAADSEAVESVATWIAPFGAPGTMTLTEESLREIDAKQSTIFEAAAVGCHAVLDAVPTDDIESPPLRLVSVAARQNFRSDCYAPRPAEVGVLLDIPLEIYREKPQPKIATTSKGKLVSSAAASDGSQGAAEAAPAGEADTKTVESGEEGASTNADAEPDMAAPFEKEEKDTNFLSAVEGLDPSCDADAKKALKQLWDENRQQAVQSARQVKLLERQVEELTSKLEKLETSQKANVDLMLRSHKAIRVYRSKLDGYFKKAMVEEVVYGNDADLFVSEWLSSMKQASLTAGGASAIAGAVSALVKNAKHVSGMSPREEFSSMMRQSIEDDGTESRANSNRLYASVLGHMCKVFSGIERLLKQRDRISRVGAGIHRKPSAVRVTSSSPPQSERQVQSSEGRRSSTTLPSLLSRAVSGARPQVAAPSSQRPASSPGQSEPTALEARKQFLRSKMKSVLSTSHEPQTQAASPPPAEQ